MSLLDVLLERTGDEAPPPRPVGFRGAVSYSGEFRRIEALPRRRWEDYTHQEAEVIHDHLAMPGGLMGLWKVQAAAIRDVVLQQGAFLPIGVGQGKALVSLLAPVALEARRPVLFVPAQLREQTRNFVIPEMERHWKLHPNLRVVGYSELSQAKNAKLLDEIRPDLVVLDECHRVKNTRAGRTRRLVRWFREHPETMCVAMSGTISSRSIRDFAHVIRWCLGDGAPVPAKWTELAEWADALDEKVPDGQRVAPGALARFCRPGENARQGFRRRLTQTPGVVATKEDRLGTSLQIVSFPGPRVPDDLSSLINRVRTNWETPNGDVITEAVELWRHVRELALGFWYRWDPPPPREWLDARREWKQYVRETLKHNQRGLDTELQVWNECKAVEEDLPLGHPWHEWVRLKDAFKPRVVTEWVHSFALQAARDWLEDCVRRVEPGICWVEHRAFGRELASFSGRSHFGAGDDGILETGNPAIVVSVAAHSEGKNLQRYCRNLVVAPMASGKAWEQLLGRTHRQGQEADEVSCDVFLHQPELVSSFGQALSDARYLEDSYGNRRLPGAKNVVEDRQRKELPDRC